MLLHQDMVVAEIREDGGRHGVAVITVRFVRIVVGDFHHFGGVSVVQCVTDLGFFYSQWEASQVVFH